MAVTNFTSLLGLALPTTGDLSGTWGTTVNDSITSLLDSAIAGTTTLSSDLDVTLSTTNGAANQARNAVINCTGARTSVKTVTAPAQSKAYVVINATTGGYGVKFVGAGPTTGVTIANGDSALVAWNGSDFVIVAAKSGDVYGPAASIDNEIALYSGTTGKLIKRATATGILKATSGVLGVAVSGTDIKTVNGVSLLGSGNVVVAANTEVSRAVTASTASTAIDFSAGSDNATFFKLSMQASTTLTFSNPPNAGTTDAFTFTLMTVNDATPGRTLAFGNTIKWAGGTMPPRTTAANAVDVWTFFNKDATYYGSLSMADVK